MKKQLSVGVLWTAAMLFLAAPVVAGPADVVDAAAKRLPNGSYIFVATIKHADVDFDHFADAFEIVSPDGKVIARRPLVHPHVDEQPFTRASKPTKIPEGTKTVIIRAHDRVHGLGGKEFTLTLE